LVGNLGNDRKLLLGDSGCRLEGYIADFRTTAAATATAWAQIARQGAIIDGRAAGPHQPGQQRNVHHGRDDGGSPKPLFGLGELRPW
jgi:hypothetical protein